MKRSGRTFTLSHMQTCASGQRVFDKSERRYGALPATDFVYNHEAVEYTCLGGKALKPCWRKFENYFARKDDCAACMLNSRCTPKKTTRKILRSKDEGVRQMERDIAKTDAYVSSSFAQKKVEMLFAHLKRILGLDRLRLRGPNGAKDEFHIAPMVPNLRKLAKAAPNLA